ncbi:hypothetical protein KZ820_17990 [Sphingomonas sp. RRHST34]|uniref:Permease n=1 Tax=Sphingomonas citri TaxID=2862499 RepID=A0ABS7BSQ1_9SPHN|nr:hypothetical protein [Sphingomonas citri]MBW6532637.1 hypothetical protein [Sphingomonas citri]
MNFVQWLASLDALLYELMDWLIFFPLTLWKIIRHPLDAMAYAEQQLLLEPERQFRGAVSPPVMLILTIVLVQGVGIVVGEGTSPIVGSGHGLAALVNDDTTLLLLRLVLFGLFALVLATRKVHRSGVELDRDTLKPAFYAQCYAIAPFAMLASGGLTIITAPAEGVVLPILGTAAFLTAFLYYGVLQVRWFSRELRQSFLRSLADAAIGMMVSIALTIGLGLLFR